uniref:Glucan endo-1,3-beta-glucosidase 8 n=1 Tax=Aegilops tauschii TaxID=37682 RepID=M8BG70_AEGTA
MLKANGIMKVKLFDADPWPVGALLDSGIEVMLGIPNDMLEAMTSYGNAEDWVAENATSYGDRLKLRYVAVGNEPFLKSYNGSFMETTVPALKNIQKALDEAGIGDTKAGVPGLKVIIGEVGWPTDGNKNANPKLARRFYDGLLKKLAKNEGTHLRQGKMDVYLFGLFDEDMKSIAPGNFERHWGILTYDGKPKFAMDLSGKGNDKQLTAVSGVEYLPKQWCVFDDEAAKEEGKDKLPGNIQYACASGDCTALGYGCSCNGLDEKSNISYAFNMYFQMQDQDVRACDFDGLATISDKNASTKECLFPVQIISAATVPARRWPASSLLLAMLVAHALVS